MDANRVITIVLLTSFVGNFISFWTVAAAGELNISVDNKRTTECTRRRSKPSPRFIRSRQDHDGFDASSASSTASSQASCDPAESVLHRAHKRMLPETFDGAVDSGYRKQLKGKSSSAAPNPGASTAKNIYAIDLNQPSTEHSNWNDISKLVFDENSASFGLSKRPPPDVFENLDNLDAASSIKKKIVAPDLNQPPTELDWIDLSEPENTSFDSSELSSPGVTSKLAEAIDLNQPSAELLNWRDLWQPVYDENNAPLDMNKPPGPPDVIKELADAIDLNQPSIELPNWGDFLKPVYDGNNALFDMNEPPSPEMFHIFEEFYTASLPEKLQLVSNFLGV